MTLSNNALFSFPWPFGTGIIMDFSIRSGQLRNVESARVSMPGQVKRY